MEHYVKEGIYIIEVIIMGGSEDEFEEDVVREGSEGEAEIKKRAKCCQSSNMVGKKKRVD